MTYPNVRTRAPLEGTYLETRGPWDRGISVHPRSGWATREPLQPEAPWWDGLRWTASAEAYRAWRFLNGLYHTP